MSKKTRKVIVSFYCYLKLLALKQLPFGYISMQKTYYFKFSFSDSTESQINGLLIKVNAFERFFCHRFVTLQRQDINMLTFCIYLYIHTYRQTDRHAAFFYLLSGTNFTCFLQFFLFCDFLVEISLALISALCIVSVIILAVVCVSLYLKIRPNTRLR